MISLGFLKPNTHRLVLRGYFFVWPEDITFYVAIFLSKPFWNLYIQFFFENNILFIVPSKNFSSCFPLKVFYLTPILSKDGKFENSASFLLSVRFWKWKKHGFLSWGCVLLFSSTHQGVRRGMLPRNSSLQVFLCCFITQFLPLV